MDQYFFNTIVKNCGNNIQKVFLVLNQGVFSGNMVFLIGKYWALTEQLEEDPKIFGS